MKIKNNNQGIAHIGAILAVLVVVAVGLVGWKVWDSRKSDEDKSKNAKTSNSTSQNNSFSSNKVKLSFKIPKDFKLIVNDNSTCPEPKPIESVTLQNYNFKFSTGQAFGYQKVTGAQIGVLGGKTTDYKKGPCPVTIYNLDQILAGITDSKDSISDAKELKIHNNRAVQYKSCYEGSCSMVTQIEVKNLTYLITFSVDFEKPDNNLNIYNDFLQNLDI